MCGLVCAGHAQSLTGEKHQLEQQLAEQAQAAEAAQEKVAALEAALASEGAEHK